ncbi:class I SAM-dependent methyltransferase [Rubripirellula reticaptiva]|nr:class I SAM-dependent methyltransferase [Rubripirellula reticaptiva]
MTLYDRLVQCEQAMQGLAGAAPDAKTITRLRREWGDDLAQLMTTSAALQSKAESKLGPGPWWVSEKSLQQSTPWQVAQLKSQWFGDRTVYDLCCGIGGDAFQLARRGPVVAVDRDETVAAMAAVNLGRLGDVKNASARCDDVTQVDVPADAAIHVDPDRRAGGRRTSDPDQYEPDWSEVLRMIDHVPAAIIKLAPAAMPEIPSTMDTARLWISLSGSVREQSLLLGEVIGQSGLQSGHRAAYRAGQDGVWSRFVVSHDQIDEVSHYRGKSNGAQAIGECLIDPDGAIRAAGLTIAFANQNRLRLVGKPSGFLTGDESVASLILNSGMGLVGRVIWSGAADDRKLRRELRSRNVYPETIKVRGSEHDPLALTRRYRSTGERPVTLWLSRAGERVYAAITEPILAT